MMPMVEVLSSGLLVEDLHFLIENIEAISQDPLCGRSLEIY